jgi:hypothetical protein
MMMRRARSVYLFVCAKMNAIDVFLVISRQAHHSNPAGQTDWRVIIPIFINEHGDRLDGWRQ